LPNRAIVFTEEPIGKIDGTIIDNFRLLVAEEIAVSTMRRDETSGLISQSLIVVFA
jgi:hypothetical protein